MKLLSFHADGQDRWGAVDDAGAIDLGARLGRYPDLLSLLRAEALAEAAQAARGAVADFALEEILFLPPVPNPEKNLCIGVNYANRNDEYADNSDLPKYPNVFMRTPGSLTGHRQPILRPPESEQFDYEGEIAIVIGKPGRRISQDRAEEHIAGLTCLNEGSVRDWMRHGRFNITQGKNFERSGAAGPWMVTADEFDGYDDLRVTTQVNGEVRQDDTTANMIFGFRYLIAYVSAFTALKPGDVISTGTPTGAGIRFDPPKWLVPGDTVEVEVTGVGTLSNRVADDEVPAARFDG
ncbi:MAG: fumarylacetoacetate hydrolase family protein [Rhodospirillaceae bacterium]|nr:fumarylacetoacetate hydrolase family protein [Rhodospirillaceae bacterium]MXW93040.1 fumarylacetoacetate hydrolase family protein [Rhodospirillaceae bacterium]MYB13495.1 fumarylacetoacetate hydrolase family protein [Rhodospirillaceae bacterium]MYG52719.1 fumarylacetoacetate hydrolase family protein [Rhodospirillaceae bacterium]MYI49881.1 fumarylacetoacetate hydrolase family protein [Rhodospirillaceae bacterium]